LTKADAGRLLLAGALVLGALPARGEGTNALTGHDIASRCYNRDNGYKTDESTALQMKLVNSSGKIRAMEFLRYQKKVNGAKKTLMKFTSPRDIRDTGTLNEEVSGSEDLQYLYLPAAQKLRRVSATQDSWMGSDISFEDISEWEFDRFTYTAMGEGVFAGNACYLYERKPKKPEYSIYSRQIEWVMKDGFRPLKTVYYDKENKELKVLEFTDLRTDSRGILYAWRITVRNVQDGHRTEITRQWLSLDVGMSDDCVTTRHLEKSVDFYDHPRNIKELWAAARRPASSESRQP
jgi:outer membrane lipoprotein-sorting protein